MLKYFNLVFILFFTSAKLVAQNDTLLLRVEQLGQDDIYAPLLRQDDKQRIIVVPGQINISAETYRLVAGQFKCTYRGEVEVKNKGKMGMYVVEQTQKIPA